MKLTKYGHSAYLVEEGDAKLLIDPGSWSSGFEDVTGLAAVLYTHVHQDHYNEDKLAALLKNNPDAKLVADEQTAAKLTEAGHEVQSVDGGDELELGGLSIKVVGHDHATIHPDFPIDKNVGYFIADKVFYPGDALTMPGAPVEVLLLPVESPWSKLWEVIDYLRAVKPKIALPSHELILATPHVYYQWMEPVAKGVGTEWRGLAQGESTEV
jgi:L-ascorbate metabolism protein UlaG (beta-lactamase superfamily)